MASLRTVPGIPLTCAANSAGALTLALLLSYQHALDGGSGVTLVAVPAMPQAAAVASTAALAPETAAVASVVAEADAAAAAAAGAPRAAGAAAAAAAARQAGAVAAAATSAALQAGGAATVPSEERGASADGMDGSAAAADDVDEGCPVTYERMTVQEVRAWGLLPLCCRPWMHIHSGC